MNNLDSGANIPQYDPSKNMPYIYSPGSSQLSAPRGTKPNLAVETKVDGFITASLVIFGVIMCFIPYGFILSVIIFYFVFRTKKYQVIVDGEVKERKSNTHVRHGLIIFSVILIVIALFYNGLINSLT